MESQGTYKGITPIDTWTIRTSAKNPSVRIRNHTANSLDATDLFYKYTVPFDRSKGIYNTFLYDILNANIGLKLKTEKKVYEEYCDIDIFSYDYKGMPIETFLGNEGPYYIDYEIYSIENSVLFEDGGCEIHDLVYYTEEEYDKLEVGQDESDLDPSVIKRVVRFTHTDMPGFTISFAMNIGGVESIATYYHIYNNEGEEIYQGSNVDLGFFDIKNYGIINHKEVIPCPEELKFKSEEYEGYITQPFIFTSEGIICATEEYVPGRKVEKYGRESVISNSIILRY